jgi:hypothetical protein
VKNGSGEIVAAVFRCVRHIGSNCLFQSTRVKRDSTFTVGFNPSPKGRGFFISTYFDEPIFNSPYQYPSRHIAAIRGLHQSSTFSPL